MPEGGIFCIHAWKIRAAHATGNNGWYDERQEPERHTVVFGTGDGWTTIVVAIGISVAGIACVNEVINLDIGVGGSIT